MVAGSTMSAANRRLRPRFVRNLQRQGCNEVFADMSRHVLPLVKLRSVLVGHDPGWRLTMSAIEFFSRDLDFENQHLHVYKNERGWNEESAIFGLAASSKPAFPQRNRPLVLVLGAKSTGEQLKQTCLGYKL